MEGTQHHADYDHHGHHGHHRQQHAYPGTTLPQSHEHTPTHAYALQVKKYGPEPDGEDEEDDEGGDEDEDEEDDGNPPSVAPAKEVYEGSMGSRGDIKVCPCVRVMTTSTATPTATTTASANPTAPHHPLPLNFAT